MADGPEQLHFIVFSDDWGVHPSSCQHLFRYIGEEHRVSWINTVGMRRPGISIADARKAWAKLSRMGGRPGQEAAVRPRFLDVYQPPMLPFADVAAARRLNKISVGRTLRQLARVENGGQPIIVTTVPNAADYLDIVDSRCIVYYCVDDFSEWPGLNKSLILSMEASLISQTDGFLATSKALFDKLSESGKPTRPLPHGVDVSHFANTGGGHAALADFARPRIGYVGLFDERSDQQLIADVASSMPDVSVIIAGPVETSTALLDRVPNVHFVGFIDYGELPAFLGGLDVLVLPYKVDELARSLSPLKMKEYLVSGKPVLSTPIPAALDLDELVEVRDTSAAWVDFIRQEISNPGCRPVEEIRSRFAAESWRAKSRELVEFCSAVAAGASTVEEVRSWAR